ncbi:hypothetical protein [Natrinema versiforme]|uniref:Uncharacterized protein n=1 Tax=Natrinema versiforme TaxID=88724 RepID=A0A4P8WFW1_9EURY|nr:hypothetical protein [Natrinema versiforme]QCS41945.1 hypothetical protein FEJ81_06085 [Natrinema versiforme]
MTTRRRFRIVRWQIAVMGATALSLAVLDSLFYGLFFGVSLLGLVVVTELSMSRLVALPWRSRLRRLAALGLLGYAVVVVLRLTDILSAGPLP